ncbi:hypothetical protein V6Z11_A08G106800 [Gossypium hirsutum]
MRTKPTKTAGIYNINSVTMLSNQVELFNKKIDSFLGSTQVHPVMRCDSSGGGVHTEYQYFNATTEKEQVNYMGNNNFRSQNNPYSNTYNAGWRNHPNFSWGDTYFQNTETALKNQQASIHGLETQIGQLISEQPQGSLPSNTEPNPREHLNAISTPNKEGFITPELEIQQDNTMNKGREEVNNNDPKYVSTNHEPRLPYPKAMMKYRTEEKFIKFMPNSAKFLKELLSNKNKLDDTLHVELNAVCTTILKNELPNKLKDPVSFTIPCLICSLSVNNALADLGASINVMPYKMFKRLGLGKGKQTRMSRQFADKTVRFPKGIIEDVLVKIDKFIYPELPRTKTTETVCYYHEENKDVHEERRLQIDKLEEWRAHKTRTHDNLKLRQNKADTSPNHLKVGDKVLLDAANPHIVTTTPNEEIPLTVLSIFPFSTVEVSVSPKTRPITRACLRPCENRAKDFPNTGYDKTPRSCDMAVVEPTKITWAGDMPVWWNRGLKRAWG